MVTVRYRPVPSSVLGSIRDVSKWGLVVAVALLVIVAPLTLVGEPSAEVVLQYLVWLVLPALVVAWGLSWVLDALVSAGLER